MIQLRGMIDKEVVEMADDTMCQLIDGLHYIETNQVRTIGAMTELSSLRAFEMVQVDTGFDDHEQPRIMSILPKRRNGIAALLASTLLMLVTGCGTGATYTYSYTCYGSGCEPPPVVHYVTGAAATPSVVYVNRPVEVHVRRDGTINTRRVASPRWRAR